MKMKIVLLLAMLFTATLSKAQICKISENNESVEVFSTVLSDNKDSVTVVISNDSADKAANCTVTVEVNYKYSHSSARQTKEYTGKGMVKPQSSCEIVIPIALYDYEVTSVRAKSITGARCL